MCQTVEQKGKKKHYVTGYISTKGRDLKNDIVTDEGLDDMLQQVLTKSIKLDVEHEVWTDDTTIIPIGKIVEAKRDEKGIFVKALINSDHGRFGEVWNSIKNGFLDAFSIAYKANNPVFRVVDGVKSRLLNSIELLNVALTGNPVNPECVMTSVFMKSLKNFEEEEKLAEEEIKQEDVAVEQKSEEQPAEEAAPEAQESSEETVPEPEKKEEEVAEAVEEPAAEEPSESVEQKAVKEEIEALKAEIKSLRDLVEEPVLKAEIKSKEQVETEHKAEKKNPLDFI